MTKPPTYAEIIALAIKNEQEAHDLYAGMAEKAETPSAKAHFTQLAKMELAHKKRLESLDASFFETHQLSPPVDLKIADYLVDVELHPGSSYQDTLLFAAKREKAAFNLYTDLAAVYASTPEVSKIFQVLAEEEAYHKLAMEREYDDKGYSEG